MRSPRFTVRNEHDYTQSLVCLVLFQVTEGAVRWVWFFMAAVLLFLYLARRP